MTPANGFEDEVKVHYCPLCGIEYDCPNPENCSLAETYVCGDCHHVVEGGGDPD